MKHHIGIRIHGGIIRAFTGTRAEGSFSLACPVTTLVGGIIITLITTSVIAEHLIFLIITTRVTPTLIMGLTEALMNGKGELPQVAQTEPLKVDRAVRTKVVAEGVKTAV